MVIADSMGDDERLSKMMYWAKTTPEGEPGIGVDQHLLRVGLMAGVLAQSRKAWLGWWGLSSFAVAYLAGLHDLGKISPGFQSKCRRWLEMNGLLDEAVRHGWRNWEGDHSRVSQFSIQNLLLGPNIGLKRSSAVWWAVAAGSHHGRVHYPGERGLGPACGMTVDRWEEERRIAASRLSGVLQKFHDEPISLPEINSDSPELWWVAGLTSVADWIGSDETFFPPASELSAEDIEARACEAVQSIGLGLPEVKPGLEFSDLFPAYEPNSLQTSTMDTIRAPGLYTIEAPMGMGKTEAALAAAYGLVSSGRAAGIYFALPTQATSNRIHQRLTDFTRHICPEAPTTRLIHANSWLLEDLVTPESPPTLPGEEDARHSRDWFASAKRALLAPFGVGTLDQALLAILAAKHFFVRRFALAGKVVIIDEVHSYDVYTGTLIGKLCEELERLGCTIILLSATLTCERRGGLLDARGRDKAREGDEPYPLISGRSFYDGTRLSVPAAPPTSKSVQIAFQTEEEALMRATLLARQGACILWICNTVNRSQQVFGRLRDQIGENLPIGLLHSRFPFFRRQALEEIWMVALGKDGARPPGCILVSTQVVEQSVDLDADLMITELAPTDMILQRMGRLWRHERYRRPVSHAECWILGETESLDSLRELSARDIIDVLGPKARVYAPYVLLRSLEIWSGRDSIRLPEQIRPILEATYADCDDLPAGWLELRGQIEGSRYAERMMAETNSILFTPALPDEEGVQTRLKGMETVSLLLCRESNKELVVLLNGDVARLDGDHFHLDSARALHRNLVRVPKWAFDAFQGSDSTDRYVRGEQALATVEDGRIHIAGLKSGVRMDWDEEMGIVVSRDEGEKNEPCD